MYSDDNVALDWMLGGFLGLGGLAGSYLGTRLQPRLPEDALRRLAGVLAVLLAAKCLADSL